MPARPGAFNANFAPETLESFKAVCRDRGEKYTKILEQFAVLYIQTRGEVLEQMSVGSSGASTSPAALVVPSPPEELMQRCWSGWSQWNQTDVNSSVPLRCSSTVWRHLRAKT